MTTASLPDLRPIDVTSWIGGYPFRDVPHPDPEVLVRVLDREGFAGAWVGHLPGAFFRDPVPSNRALYAALKPYAGVLHPTPIVRPDWPGWTAMLRDAVNAGAPAVRVYPAQWGLGPGHPAMAELALACGEAGVALHVTVRFEDLRQRHPMDSAGDVPAATLRAIARLSGSRCQLVVAGAGRDLIEETHWGLTPAEQQRVFYDFGWVWGPPEDHFAHVVATIGAQRLAWSSWWPLRLTQQSRALIDLLPRHGPSPLSEAIFADGRAILEAAQRVAQSRLEPQNGAGTTLRTNR
ncbi:hypothetical protein [Gemmatimonas groenlandica]|uniref:Amidohydrolase-related domain-containing protein n=1 Tax=Gemmatimonas groenlandica TaxID=2732249 RepID=A0A6M4IJH0_9BACT|nr:hypothetical protein [Gemmatimonas groenlandica]QJR34770.1 hypothetical protein HKW67_04185 [Gemmatimonas groenlandica]